MSTLNGQDILVNNFKYPGSVGLYKLLFKKKRRDLEQHGYPKSTDALTDIS